MLIESSFDGASFSSKKTVIILFSSLLLLTSTINTFYNYQTQQSYYYIHIQITIVHPISSLTPSYLKNIKNSLNPINFCTARKISTSSPFLSNLINISNDIPIIGGIVLIHNYSLYHHQFTTKIEPVYFWC